MTKRKGTIRITNPNKSLRYACCELGDTSGGRLHNAGCPYEQMLANWLAAKAALGELLNYFDFPSNSWTAADVRKLAEIRAIAEGRLAP